MKPGQEPRISPIHTVLANEGMNPLSKPRIRTDFPEKLFVIFVSFVIQEGCADP